MNEWKVYSDGGCVPNPGPAAWGAVIETPAGELLERSAFIGAGTNQIAELTGALEGLRLTPAGATVILICDSQYVLKGLTEWRRGWERRNWHNAQGEPVANAALWLQLFAIADKRQVQTQWVRGHTGHAQNERADALATQALRSA